MVCIFGGFLGFTLGIPAGWLICSIITGIIWGVFRGGYSFDGRPFKIALAFVAANIGLKLDPKIIFEIRFLIFPLLLTILLTITIGYFLSILLYRNSNLDQVTAFFCCIPGGASEIISISKEYGADERIVAAFHTVRITFFVLTIPIIIGYLNTPAVVDVIQDVAKLEMSHFYFFPIVVFLTLFLDAKLRIPGGALLFSIAISFLLSSFVIDIALPPSYLSGIGQALIGGMVGGRFDKKVLAQLVSVGKITIAVIGIFFVVSILMSGLFHFMTKLSFSISLIGTVPAGAAEMSATAIALDISPSIVATLHIVRIMVIFFTLPLLIKIFKKLNKNIESVS